MTLIRNAFHIRTGERSAAEAIDGWAEKNGIEMADCADALEACVYLLKYATHAPDLAFIGTDWLMTEEFVILEYLRVKWPQVRMIVYGNTPETADSAQLPLTLACPSLAALRQVLAGAPERLENHPAFAISAGLETQSTNPTDTLAEPAQTPDDFSANLLAGRAASLLNMRPPQIAPETETDVMPCPPASRHRHVSLSDPRPLRTLRAGEELAALSQDTDA